MSNDDLEHKIIKIKLWKNKPSFKDNREIKNGLKVTIGSYKMTSEKIPEKPGPEINQDLVRLNPNRLSCIRDNMTKNY